MVSLETTAKPVEPFSGPRISFSAEFLDENDFITITPNIPQPTKNDEKQRDKTRSKEFEFLSSNKQKMQSADELFSQGKLLPFWRMQQSEKLDKMTIKTEEAAANKTEDVNNKEENSMNRFLDDDPSPRPPTCTVLWKELLQLKKHRASSTLSSSSSSSVSTAELPEEGNGEKKVKRSKKTLERRRSGIIRTRPVINVPICTQGMNTALPPRFSFRKGKLER